MGRSIPDAVRVLPGRTTVKQLGVSRLESGPLSRAPATAVRRTPARARRYGLGGRGRGPNRRPSDFQCRPRGPEGSIDVDQQASDLRVCGGQGRGRTADLPIFSRTLVPTELPGRGPAREPPNAVLTGFEPAASTLTGWRALQTAPQDLAVLRAPNGIRTRATALKGRRPGPLDDEGGPAIIAHGESGDCAPIRPRRKTWEAYAIPDGRSKPAPGAPQTTANDAVTAAWRCRTAPSGSGSCRGRRPACRAGRRRRRATG